VTEQKPSHTNPHFDELKAEHRRALKAQDVEALQRVQAKLHKLMAREGKA
jgi:hypothetical protein